MPYFRADPLGFVQRLSRMGDVTSVHILGRRGWILSHPDHVEALLVGQHRDVIKDRMTRELATVLGDGLLVADGERWRRQRRLAAPSFTPRAVGGYAKTMAEVSLRHVAAWPAGPTDIHARFVALTRDIVLKTVFGTDTATEAAEAVEVFQTEFVRQIRTVRRVLPRWVPTRGRRRIEAAVRELDRDVARIVADRRANGLGDDLLSRLIAATDEDGKPAFSDAQLRDEVVTLYLAGHETTALALTYAAWLLARHPEASARLRDEVRALSAPPGLADLGKLPWTSAVVDETLRLYPPAWAIGREPVVPVEVGGYTIPAGDTVWAFPWAIHRDARFWPQPSAFRPERFLAQDPARHRFAFFPFGGGPRVCIGSHFARMEAVIALATVMREVHFALDGDAPLQFLAAVTLRPAAGVPLRVLRE
jgi:cytochrome P450